jgi:sterol desaturase/sphingolipid hydroxylase (fatty acid hydroxylase superfamily)
MINALIITPIVLAVGAPAFSIIMYSLIRTAVDLFSHSNIVLPQNLDKVLRLFIITPDFHRMHHASNQKYTDSNYSTFPPSV